MLFYFNFITPLISISSPLLESISDAASLAWDANKEEDLRGYKIYYGISPGIYSSVIYVGNITTHPLTRFHLLESINYYIAITAIDYNGNESAFSTELKFFTDDTVPDGIDNCPTIYNPDQQDYNGNGCGDLCECFSDYNGDSYVDGDDSRQLKKDYGTRCPCVADGNDDGFVDGDDYLLLKAEYGRNECCSYQ